LCASASAGTPGEGLGQQLAEPRDRQRPLGQQPTARGHQVVGRDVAGGPAHLAAVALPVEGRLHPRSQREGVVGGEHVDGAAQGEEPHRLPSGERAGQLLGVEAVEAGREGEVRRQVLLRLQADEVLDHLQRRDRRAREQVLAQQQRPVEVPAAQHPSTLEVSDGRP
jgi:hypothetical protein